MSCLAGWITSVQSKQLCPALPRSKVAHTGILVGLTNPVYQGTKHEHSFVAMCTHSTSSFFAGHLSHLQSQFSQAETTGWLSLLEADV